MAFIARPRDRAPASGTRQRSAEPTAGAALRRAPADPAPVDPTRPDLLGGGGEGGLAALQRLAGNRAVGALVGGRARCGPAALAAAPGVQRDVGWSDAQGWNKQPHDLAGKDVTPVAGQHQIVRIPLQSLSHGNQAKSPNPEKTSESAAGRAIVWVRPDIDITRPVQVLVHLHGLTSREADPFPGWRETNDDPKTEESDDAKNAAIKAGVKKPANPLAHQVRDVVRDRIGEQVNAMNDPQLIAVLPQGSGGAEFGKSFDADVVVTEVLGQLKDAKVVPAAPANYTIILAAHSGGGFTVTSALDAGRTSHVGGVILFDALHTKKGDPTKSGQLDALLDWIGGNCRKLGKQLKDPAVSADAKTAAIAALPGFRGYYEAGYSTPYEGLQGQNRTLQAQIDAMVAAAVPAAYQAQVKAKFVVTKVATKHDQIVGGAPGATGVSAAPLQDALSNRGTFVARSAADATVQRDDHHPAPVAVTLSWTGDLPNAGQLQPVLTAHPADLTAEVSVDGGAPVTVAPPHPINLTPGPHTVAVRPTVGSPGDYFLPGVERVTVAAAGGPVSVTLPFNRDNVRFTERTWVVNNIDPAKANNVNPASLFGLAVKGGLNDLTAPRVQAANNWFAANVTAADQATARGSVVSLVGTVKRAQTRGTFSNHSTGAAVDINPSSESLQNWHVKKTEARDARAMGIFNTVVALQTPAEQLLAKVESALLGVPVPMPFSGFDVWRERDRDRLLEASQRFNAAFPDYLLGLVTAADPAAAPAPTTASVMSLTAADLKALARKAKLGGHADVAMSLTGIAKTWFEIRAWVTGYVWTNRFHGQDRVGMLHSDFAAAQAADPTLQSKGEMVGMVSLHPAIVKALTESGWSWLVDYAHDNEKDFMHFEDRQAQADMHP